jgi:hypothetical protein
MGDPNVDILVVDDAPLPPSSDSEPAANPGPDQSISQSLSDRDDSELAEPEVHAPPPDAEPVFVPVTFEEPDDEQSPGAARAETTEGPQSRCCLLL